MTYILYSVLNDIYIVFCIVKTFHTQQIFGINAHNLATIVFEFVSINKQVLSTNNSYYAVYPQFLPQHYSIRHIRN